MKYTLILLPFIFLSCATRFAGNQCKPPAEYRNTPVPTILREAKEIVSRPGEKKAITFCVYGKKKMYTYGVLENIDIAKDLYPTWDVVIFFDSKTVPQDIIDKAKEKGAKVFVGPQYANASSRFFVADMDYDRFISRDADSRIYPREVAAVADWMKEDWAILHGMHDKEGDFDPLLAGMFGALIKPLREKLKANTPTHEDNMQKLYEHYIGDRKAVYGDDQIFLKDVVLKAVGLDHFMTHESYKCQLYPHSRGFPIPRGTAGVHIGGVRNWD